MRALYSNNRGEMYLKEVPEPTLQGSGVVIRTLASVFGAGSEMAGVARRRKAIAEGQDPGPLSEKAHSYQSAGEVLQVSDDLQDRFQRGDLVAAAGGGFGFHAEQGWVPKHSFAKIPDGLSPLEAATTNVGLTAFHAMRRAVVQPGETAVVLGLGMVGQITAQLVGMVGGQAIGVDLHEFRLEKARELGAAATASGADDEVAAAVDAFTDGRGADAVFIATSARIRGPASLAVRLVRESGRVLLIGRVIWDFTPTHPDADPHTKEIDIHWVNGRGPGSRERDYLRGETEYPNRFVRWDQEQNLQALLALQGARGAAAHPPVRVRPGAGSG
ncbi:MAG: zinc-binding alcohol dehydrogenase [Chloroflexota bacterium]|nr:zinc-binding alcohol dehydrogenase [Chloroflexota bacterium]